MAASLRQIAELNNSGASMLVAARDKDAFRILQNTLAIMERQMLMSPDKRDSSTTTATSATSTRVNPAALRSSTSSNTSNMSNDSSRSSTDSERGEPSSSASSSSADSTAPPLASAEKSTPATTTTTTTTTTRSTSTSTSTVDCSNAARFVMDSKRSTEIPELKDDRYFIFNQALLLDINCTTLELTTSASSSDDADSRRPTQSLVCFYTAVTIFNLALAYHKRGMTAVSASSAPTSAAAAPSSLATGMAAVSLTSNASSSSSSSSAAASIAPPPPPPSSPSTPSYSSRSPPPPQPQHHQQHLRRPRKESAQLALSQSLRLYEHCLKIVRSIANYSEDCKLLLYAVSCNLAYLYCRKGERSRAQELLNDLDEANRLSYMNLC